MGDVFVGDASSRLEWVAAVRPARRWRIWAVVAFLALGLAFASAYASGFATIGGATGAANGAARAFEPGAGEDAALLADQISSPGDLRWSWRGQWGSIESQVLYELDLDSLPASNRYFSSVMLTNEPTGFASLQLQLRLVDAGPGGACTPAALVGANQADSRVMAFGSTDAQVTFAGLNRNRNGLPGGTTYCVGIADYPGAGTDRDGTFIRKSDPGSGFSGRYPELVAALERGSG